MEKYGVKCGRDFVGVIRFGDFGIGAYFGISNCRRLSSLHFGIMSIIFCWVLHATHNQNKRVRVMSTANDKRKCCPNPKHRFVSLSLLILTFRITAWTRPSSIIGNEDIVSMGCFCRPWLICRPWVELCPMNIFVPVRPCSVACSRWFIAPDSGDWLCGITVVAWT